MKDGHIIYVVRSQVLPQDIHGSRVGFEGQNTPLAGFQRSYQRKFTDGSSDVNHSPVRLNRAAPAFIKLVNKRFLHGPNIHPAPHGYHQAARP